MVALDGGGAMPDVKGLAALIFFAIQNGTSAVLQQYVMRICPTFHSLDASARRMRQVSISLFVTMSAVACLCLKISARQHYATL